MAAAYGAGRVRIISRPGLEQFAGPTPRQLVVARWLPLFFPLVFQLFSLLGLHFSPVYFLIVSVVLWLSARKWSEIGSGLGLLVLLQLIAGGLATVLSTFNVLDPQPWLRYCTNTALMMGYVSFFFNLLSSYLPR
jgi:hypothetical protein